MHNLVPILSFKSNYGGINFLTFENEKSPLVALACQDDSTIILSLETKTYIRICGHISFVSRSIFQDVSEEFIRLITASYDGTISVNEIEKNVFEGTSITEKDLPVQIVYSKADAQ